MGGRRGEHFLVIRRVNKDRLREEVPVKEADDEREENGAKREEEKSNDVWQEKGVANEGVPEVAIPH
jgi:hypothetical protein